MKKNISITFITATLLMLMISCDKSPLTNGDIDSQTRNIERFDTLYIYDNINVNLVPAEENKVEIVAPKNLIKNISTTAKNSELTLRNENKNDWIRDYDYSIDVTIYHSSKISKIYYAGVGDVNSTDYIVNDTISDFDLIVENGGGKIDLDLRCSHLYTHTNGGSTEVRLHGSSKTSYLRQDSFGPIYADDFSTDRVKASTIGNNHIYVNSCSYLNARIFSSGNIYYKGQPKIVSYISPYAQGKIIAY